MFNILQRPLDQGIHQLLAHHRQSQTPQGNMAHTRNSGKALLHHHHFYPVLVKVLNLALATGITNEKNTRQFFNDIEM